MHGYALTQECKKRPEVRTSEKGVVYTALKRLRARGLVSQRWDTRTIPARKVYRVTPKGRQTLQAAQDR